MEYSNLGIQKPSVYPRILGKMLELKLHPLLVWDSVNDASEPVCLMKKDLKGPFNLSKSQD